VAACGIVCAAGLCFHLGYDPAALNPAVLAWPPLPLVPAAAILVAALAGFAAPPPPITTLPVTTLPVTTGASA
jgi:energy-coupling factor transport system permease protein